METPSGFFNASLPGAIQGEGTAPYNLFTVRTDTCLTFTISFPFPAYQSSTNIFPYKYNLTENSFIERRPTGFPFFKTFTTCSVLVSILNCICVGVCIFKLFGITAQVVYRSLPTQHRHHRTILRFLRRQYF